MKGPVVAHACRVLPGTLLALLIPAALPAAQSAAVSAEPLEELVVTARRLPMPRLDFAGSLSRLEADAIALVGPTHHSEVLNRIPGVNIQRGSGQESLTAIRSPVLTGPGSCGAFLVLEDGLPIRPVGFCNVNQLFELNFEQAAAVEVVRGPGPVTYGANAMHGIVNVVTPGAASLAPLALALEGGSDEYRRARFATGGALGASALGLQGLYTRDGGFRQDSGFEEAKLNLLADRPLAGGELRLRGSGTWLDQDTAGFVEGFDAYRDPQLRTANFNPEAFREAWSARLAAHWARESCAGCGESLHVGLRRSQMDFLQHFLLGKPLERNGQTSLVAAGTLTRPLSARLTAHGGLDAEIADTELLEIQDGPTLEGPPQARAIRPAGRHYDYAVRALTGGAFAALELRASERVRVGAALRLDYTRYGYDNRMLAGNTDERGVPCPFGGCLYSRPADRDDAFTNVTPKLDVSYAPGENSRLYASVARGFRPPEITELYRLQRQQSVAELDSERLDSLEIGWLGASERFGWALAAFWLRKDDVILRDADAFNISGGSTRHRGLEYELRARPAPWLSVLASGTLARHRYEFTRAVAGGELIVAGNEVDTAPRQLHNLSVLLEAAPRVSLELELAHVGEYYLDAANEHRYPGHTLANARLAFTLTDDWRALLRVANLLDRRYADRADFAFGDYRYFPGRERGWFVEIAYAPR